MGINKKEILVAFFVLFFATFGIALTNYHPYTFLSGWDDLHSEFNLGEHFIRSLMSLWQEHQGTGALAGTAYASDLPRLVYILILSWFFPTSVIRYAFHFSMLFVGALGAYVAIKNFFISPPGKIRHYGGLFGALFYLFNLGTVQYFATPFEPFSVFWAMFPWLMYGVFRYLHSPTRSNLILFAVLHLLATPMAYVPTIFYIYLLVLMLLFATHLLAQRSKKALLTVGTAFLVFMLVNAFWFLPHAYWFATSRSVQQNAIINTLTTEETHLRAEEFGDLSDFMLLKNKPWDYRDFVNENRETFLLQPWHDHFAHPYVPAIGYAFFLIALFGIVTNKSKRWFLIGLALMSYLVLASQAPVSREFNLLFRKIDIVNQVLRDPFTKFLVPTIFLFAVGFSGGIIFLYRLIPTRLKKPVSFVGAGMILVALFVYMAPVYSGDLIAQRMRVTIPTYYFDFFAYMNKQDPAKRIANLPQGPVWGWASYNWAYTGSGFLWHGIKQPIIDRTFDVWNDYDEAYFWEITYALNKKDYTLFNSVLQKYQISYVMFDSSLYFPDNPNSIFGTLRQSDFIAHDPALKKVASFGSLSVYEIATQNKEFVSLVADAPRIATNTKWLQNDKAYQDYGTYIADTKPGSQVVYPFRSLFSGRGTKDVMYQIEATQSSFLFHATVPDGSLSFPEDIHNEFIRYDQETLKASKKIPQVLNNTRPIAIASGSSLAQGDLAVVIDKDNRYGSFDTQLQKDTFIGTGVDCLQEKSNLIQKWSQKTVTESGEKFIRFDSTNAVACRVIYLPELPHESGYIIAIKSRNKSGNALRFWVENLTSKRSDEQVYLKKQSDFDWEYYILPSMEEDGVGYAVHFDNIAIGKQQSVNDLAQVIVYPLPYQFLTGTKIITKDTPKMSSLQNDAIVSVSHPAYYSYTVSLNKEKFSGNPAVVLYQSYNPGWKAYIVDGWFAEAFPGLFGTPLKEHVMINNWANGWTLPDLKNKKSSVKVEIVFMPQLLEYFGFVLLFVPFAYVILRRKRGKKKVEN